MDEVILLFHNVALRLINTMSNIHAFLKILSKNMSSLLFTVVFVVQPRRFPSFFHCLLPPQLTAPTRGLTFVGLLADVSPAVLKTLKSVALNAFTTIIFGPLRP